MSFEIMIILCFLIFCIFLTPAQVNGNQDAKRLYENLFKNYNILIRPVENSSDYITVKLGLKLTKIVELEWTDNGLKWNPSEYNDLKQLYVPADKLWLPDIVLYNNADDAYEVAIRTKAIIHNDGKIVWQSPASLKSHCDVDVRYFPLDEQICSMKFGTWSYGSMINLKHRFRSTKSEPGIDLTDYYLNLEWDIMNVQIGYIKSAQKRIYNSEPYTDLQFTIRLRRKTLFYTFSLLIPCIGLSFCTVFVFYLPTNSREKMSLTISILVITFLLLLFIDIMHSTSLCLPLLGKYFCFILALVCSCIVVTCFIINVHFRSPSTHTMSPWLRRLFLHTLPPYLLISLPENDRQTNATNDTDSKSNDERQPIFDTRKSAQSSMNTKLNETETTPIDTSFTSALQQRIQSPTGEAYYYPYPTEVNRAIRNALFIAYHMDNEDAYENCKEDWQIMALVLDRIFSTFFSSFIFSVQQTRQLIALYPPGIFLQAPRLYDYTSFHLESILHTF